MLVSFSKTWSRDKMVSRSTFTATRPAHTTRHNHETTTLYCHPSAQLLPANVVQNSRCTFAEEQTICGVRARECRECHAQVTGPTQRCRYDRDVAENAGSPVERQISRGQKLTMEALHVHSQQRNLRAAKYNRPLQ